jgi:hypothetical protein
MPDHENERQQSVNDFWPCIMVNRSTMWLLTAIYKVVTGFIGENAQYHLVAALNMN